MPLLLMLDRNAIALIDCNNFFVSCERVFDPLLEKRPVVVLSNNDGCIISRSDEVKKMGVKMAVPLFKVRDLLEKNNTAILSSNIEHYCEISRRVMNSIRENLGQEAVEVYSIDEAFIDLGTPDKSEEVGKYLKQKVWDETGIPISVGIAKTKTLAKLTNHIAKKSKKTEGVLNLYDSPYLETALKQTPVEKIWGIGHRNAKRLYKIGVNTALDLRNSKVWKIRRTLNVFGARTVLELRGEKCFPFERTIADKKTIAHTRSFGEPLTTYREMRNAVLNFANRAVERMRRDRLAAKSVTVFIQTNRFKDDHFSRSRILNSIYHSNLPHEINDWTLQCFKEIFESGKEYKKAGVILSGLIRADKITNRLFENEQFRRWQVLADIMDELNFRYGRDTVKLANIWDMGNAKSLHTLINEKAELPTLMPEMDSNTSEFRRFL